MKRLLTRGTLAAALVVALPSRAVTRDEIAKRHAPVFFQEVRDKTRDLYTAYDFDGNWAGDDNEENIACVADAKKCAGSPCAGGKCAVIGTVYFTVIETATHWFVQYMPYHPRDTKATNGHEHDTESVLAVVAKDASTAEGKLVALETRFHSEWFTYADPSVKGGAKAPHGVIHVDLQGHPQVYSQQVGHGICGGFSPPNNLFPDLQLTCNHAEAPHIAGTGVVYRPDVPAAPPIVIDGKGIEAGYALVEMLTSFWARRAEIGPGKTFKSTVDFVGERCTVLQCPKQFGGAFMGDGGESPSGPWDQEGGAGVSAKGSQFFDPAFTMSKRLAFPQPFSLDYCHNPYLGIVDACPTSSSSNTPGSASPSPETGKPSETAASTPAVSESEPTADGCVFTKTKSAATRWPPALLLILGIVVRRSRRAIGTASRRPARMTSRSRAASWVGRPNREPPPSA